MGKLLFVITTYNQSEYTKICLDSLKLIDEKCDILVIDDASTDNTIDLCNTYDIEVISKKEGMGLTDSWNKSYRYFVDNNYSYFIIANNDIIVPNGALSELKNTLDKWPSSLVVPLSTKKGAGHNTNQIIDNWWGKQVEYENPNHVNEIQNMILKQKEKLKSSNNLYMLDPIRQKMFNGFFFMMNKKICEYEREDGNLFNPEFLMTKNEDEFNWANLIPNNDFSILCKTAFIYHFKGVSTYDVVEDYMAKSNNKDWIKNRK